MAAQIDATPFLPALRKMIRAIPFNDTDRTVLLAAVEQCVVCHHNIKEAAAARLRPPRKRQPSTPETRLRQKLYKRARRALQRAAAVQK